MTVSTTGRSVTYNGNGSTTVFPYPFRIFDEADLVVTAISAAGVETILTLSTHYTVSGEDDDTGGNVTMLTAPATGTTLQIERILDETQPVDFTNQGQFFAETHERAFDRVTMLVQQRASITEIDALIATAVAGLTAGTYNPVLATAASVARTLQSRFADAPGIDEFGGDKTGAVDSSAAVLLAIAQGFHVLRVNGTYRMAPSSPIALPFGFKFIGYGYGLSTLVKATTGNVFTVLAAGVDFVNVGFDADVATNTAFGTSGAMIDYTGGIYTAAEGSLYKVVSRNIDTVIQFGPDGGSRHQVFGGYWLPYTTTAGSEGRVYRTGVGGDDTGARIRKIIGLTTDGQIDLSGASDSVLGEVDCRRVIFTATTVLPSVSGGIWGSLNQPVTINGSGTRIQGVRIAGAVTLAAGMSGACVFVGNEQTFGTFTDNTTAGVCMIFHKPLSVGYFLINKFKISQSVNPEEILSNRVSTDVGDAALTITLDQSAKTFRLSSVLTADRAATLPATGRDGFRYRFVRQAGATGAFNWNIKTSGGTTLVALTAEKRWAEVDWDGPTAAFILTAYGTLP